MVISAIYSDYTVHDEMNLMPPQDHDAMYKCHCNQCQIAVVKSFVSESMFYIRSATSGCAVIPQQFTYYYIEFFFYLFFVHAQ